MTIEEKERLTTMEKMLESQSAWIQQQKTFQVWLVRLGRRKLIIITSHLS